ncbi:F-box domain containing protein [Ditylenchus destructor]|nr:F-box domain containing protein [Ditylenchus destructor]
MVMGFNEYLHVMETAGYSSSILFNCLLLYLIKYYSTFGVKVYKYMLTIDAVLDLCLEEKPYAAQIFEKLPWQNRLKVEQVCKKWQHVAKNLSWSTYRIFDNIKYENWPESKYKQIKPFFERCGRHVRHLTLRSWPAHTALSFLRMAPNVHHLRFWHVKLNGECLKELAQIVPGLKSLDLEVSLRGNEKATNLDPMECTKTMTCLEYLYVYEVTHIFSLSSFVQFPLKLKYLALYGVSDAAQILSWVAKECHNLKGLRLSCSIDENALQAISQMKTLTYLAFKWASCDVENVFEALTELRALEIHTLDEKVITAIARYCKKLEHLNILDNWMDAITPEKHATILRLASLPNLCSLSIWASSYTKEQTAEFVSRLIANGNVQYIHMKTSQAPLEPEILYEMLRRCKRIRTIALNFGQISPDVYSRICQVVNEIDEDDTQQHEFTGVTHPVVDVQCSSRMAEYTLEQHKWLRLKYQVSPPAVFEKWQYGWLSSGKPEWASLYLSNTPEF